LLLEKSSEERRMTVNEIKDKILTDDRWLERGILAIWKFQTASEKARVDTHLHNNCGFNGTDGKFLTSLGNWLNKGGHLSVKQKAVARRKMGKYAAQLWRIAEGKQTTSAAPYTPPSDNPSIRGWQMIRR
jgi:hypothetical protein